MRKLKDALSLKFETGQPQQQIAHTLDIYKGVVTKYLGMAVVAALDWAAIAAMHEAGLELRSWVSGGMWDKLHHGNLGTSANQNCIKSRPRAQPISAYRKVTL